MAKIEGIPVKGAATAPVTIVIDQLHPGARKAHEAAHCAKEQEKFWAYHNMLFANAPKASPQQLRAYTQEVDLDVAALKPCLSSTREALP
jgi:protein-disulfide isomerase